MITKQNYSNFYDRTHKINLSNCDQQRIIKSVVKCLDFNIVKIPEKVNGI